MFIMNLKKARGLSYAPITGSIHVFLSQKGFFYSTGPKPGRGRMRMTSAVDRRRQKEPLTEADSVSALLTQIKFCV